MATVYAMYAYKRSIRVDGEVAGEARQPIELPPGEHVIDLGQPEDYEPLQQRIEVPADASEPIFVDFLPAPPSFSRFSALYNRYNGFMLGQFLAWTFAGFARDRYTDSRRRILEFLSEHDVEFDLPSVAPEPGTVDHLEIARQVGESFTFQPLRDFMALGMAMGTYNCTSDADRPQSADAMRRISGRYDLPAAWIDETLASIPDVRDEPQVEPTLSASLHWLAHAVSRLDVEPDTAFVVMPFSEPFASRFTTLYRPILERAGLRAFRAWGGFTWEDYGPLLLALISRCGLVLADLSDANPNVLYEVGVADARSKQTILIVDEARRTHVPANIGRNVVATYSTAGPDWAEKEIQSLAIVALAAKIAARTGAGPDPDADLAPDLDGEMREVFEAGVRALETGGDGTTPDVDPVRVARASVEIRSAPDPSAGYTHRAMQRFAMGDHAGAARDLTAAIEGGGRICALLRMRALSHLRAGQHFEALGDLEAVVDADPTDGDAHYLRALVHEALRQRDACLASLDAARDLGGEPARLDRCRCRIEARTGRANEARAAVARALETDPGNPANLDCAADAAFAAGELEPAAADRRAALAAADTPRRRLAAAITSAFAGDIPQALQHCRVSKSHYTVAELDWGLREIALWENLLETAQPHGAVNKLCQRLVELQDPDRAMQRWARRRNHGFKSQIRRKLQRQGTGARW